MIAKIVFGVIFILVCIYFGVMVGFGKVIFWIIGGLVIGFVGALIKYLLNNKKNANTQQENDKATSKTEEIKKYKELLDSGAITQQEFEEKKKQILDE